MPLDFLRSDRARSRRMLRSLKIPSVNPLPSEEPSSTSPLVRRAFWAGPLGALVVFFVTRSAGLPFEQSATAAVATICAIWWVGQPVPIPVTSLIPFFALPFFGIVGHTEVAHSYGHTLVLLLMAGFMLSTAIEACGAHRRLALGMTRLVSGRERLSPRRLLMGFMLAAAGASMWISNTATTLILLPIVLASSQGESARELRRSLLLGVAYAASIGGIGTPIGTPPNLLFMAAHEELGQPAWSFTQWMKIGVPVVLVMLPAAYLILLRSLPTQILPALERLEPPSTRERRVLIIFGLTALGWITRQEPFGGWTALVGAGGVGDATVAFGGLLAMLLVPDGEGGRLLSWNEAEKIPWGIVLLFGGGIALASGFQNSGLSATLGEALASLTSTPKPVMILGVCLTVTFLTEVTSNTATTALLMPILGATATAAGLPPAQLMVPAALSASCAFMLPVATAPNAIIFASGQVETGFMARNGVILNVLGSFLITGVCLLLL